VDAVAIRESAITAHHRTSAESSVCGALAETLRREGRFVLATAQTSQEEQQHGEPDQQGPAGQAGEYRFFAGWRSDPFFCDVAGAKNNLQFTGDDFFADKNVCSIVIEVPNSALGAEEIRLWARKLLPGDGGGWSRRSVERGRRKLSYLSRGERRLPRGRARRRCAFRS
jgi:hypothetical protein